MSLLASHIKSLITLAFIWILNDKTKLFRREKCQDRKLKWNFDKELFSAAPLASPAPLASLVSVHDDITNCTFPSRHSRAEMCFMLHQTALEGSRHSEHVLFIDSLPSTRASKALRRPFSHPVFAQSHEFIKINRQFYLRHVEGALCSLCRQSLNLSSCFIMGNMF